MSVGAKDADSAYSIMARFFPAAINPLSFPENACHGVGVWQVRGKNPDNPSLANDLWPKNSCHAPWKHLGVNLSC